LKEPLQAVIKLHVFSLIPRKLLAPRWFAGEVIVWCSGSIFTGRHQPHILCVLPKISIRLILPEKIITVANTSQSRRAKGIGTKRLPRSIHQNS
jgi:hypothetical protein